MATPMKRRAVVRVAFNYSLVDGLNYPGWDLLFAPGLQACKKPETGKWLLVHQDSGLHIGGNFRTLDEVLEFARELSPLYDWSVSAKVLREDTSVRLKVEGLLQERLAQIVDLKMEELRAVAA